MEDKAFINSANLIDLLGPLVDSLGLYSNNVEVIVKNTEKQPLKNTEYTIRSFLEEKQVAEEIITTITNMPYSFKVIIVNQQLATKHT
jgi:hypothetical protein